MSSYNNFVFYGSWREVLEGYREDFGDEYAKETLWNLMLMATAGDVETDKKSIINFVRGACMPNIEAAQDRYEKAIKNGAKGGRPKAISENDNKTIASMRFEGKKQIEIARYFNVSCDTIRRSDGWQNWQNYTAKVLQDSFDEKDAKLAKLPCKTQNPEIEKDIEIEKEIDKKIEALHFMDREAFDFEYNCFIQNGLSESEAKKNALEVIDMIEE